MKKKQLAVRLAALFAAAVTATAGLTGCKNEPEESTENTEYLAAYEDYVQSVLDTNYHGEFDDYMAITGATEQQAANINEAHAVNLAQQLAEVYDIHYSELPAEIGSSLVDICSDIYKKAGYSVDSVDKSGDTVCVTISIQPIEFVQSASAAVEKYTDEFNDRAKAGEFENMTESEYENEYAKGILEVLAKAVEKVSYAETVTYKIQIQYNAETGVSYIGDEDLDKINQLIIAE